MKNKKTTGVYLNPLIGCGVLSLDLSDGLDILYKWLDCRFITHTYRNVGGREFLILCDDEGLLRENYPSAIDGENVQLVGNLFILNANCAEDLADCSLSKNDIDHIYRNVVLGMFGKLGSDKVENKYHCLLLGD